MASDDPEIPPDPTPLIAAPTDVAPLTQHIGAEIRGVDLRQRPDDQTVKEIYQAWLDHLVLVFPGQNLSQEDLLRATTFFGEPGRLDRASNGAHVGGGVLAALTPI